MPKPRKHKPYCSSVANEVRTTIGPEGWMKRALADPAFKEAHTTQSETRHGQYVLDPSEELIERRRLAFWREKHAVLICSTLGLLKPESGDARDEQEEA